MCYIDIVYRWEYILFLLICYLQICVFMQIICMCYYFLWIIFYYALHIYSLEIIVLFLYHLQLDFFLWCFKNWLLFNYKLLSLKELIWCLSLYCMNSITDMHLEWTFLKGMAWFWNIASCSYSSYVFCMSGMHYKDDTQITTLYIIYLHIEIILIIVD